MHVFVGHHSFPQLAQGDFVLQHVDDEKERVDAAFRVLFLVFDAFGGLEAKVQRRRHGAAFRLDAFDQCANFGRRRVASAVKEDDAGFAQMHKHGDPVLACFGVRIRVENHPNLEFAALPLFADTEMTQLVPHAFAAAAAA